MLHKFNTGISGSAKARIEEELKQIEKKKRDKKTATPGGGGNAVVVTEAGQLQELQSMV